MIRRLTRVPSCKCLGCPGSAGRAVLTASLFGRKGSRCTAGSDREAIPTTQALRGRTWNVIYEKRDSRDLFLVARYWADALPEIWHCEKSLSCLWIHRGLLATDRPGRSGPEFSACGDCGPGKSESRQSVSRVVLDVILWALQHPTEKLEKS